MTIIVSVKFNDGIIMAADSASTFGNGQIYLTADKMVNLVKGLPIGVMATGSGGIGAESLATLLKDLRQRLSGKGGPEWAQWKLHPAEYTMEEVAGRVREFLFDKAKQQTDDYYIRLRICGYSAGRPLPEIWEVVINGRIDCNPPAQVQGEQEFGPRWDGEYEAMNRVILGYSMNMVSGLKEGCAMSEPKVYSILAKIVEPLGEMMVLPAMPVQDAIDLARFMVETTIAYVRFAVMRQPKSVGGPVEIAAITKHEGFRWVQRRHFYQESLNPVSR
jgi:20S proteasome alpha/beta subunit